MRKGQKAREGCRGENMDISMQSRRYRKSNGERRVNVLLVLHDS